MTECIQRISKIARTSVSARLNFNTLPLETLKNMNQWTVSSNTKVYMFCIHYPVRLLEEIRTALCVCFLAISLNLCIEGLFILNVRLSSYQPSCVLYTLQFCSLSNNQYSWVTIFICEDFSLSGMMFNEM